MAQLDFENLLKETMGLDAASVGSTTIENAVLVRMGILGCNQIEEYWEKLRTSDDELQELIEAVVVPETWFFRDRDAFTALSRLVFDEWLPRNPTSVLRLLSVPCCSGEEPYSMGMALRDAGLSGEKFKIDAVDISVRALIRAKRGVYGSNSFRSDNLAFRDRYFQQVPNGYSLSESLRDAVTFRHGNLLASDFRIGSAPYDVIFCRNVLIYFDRVTQERVMKILDRLLSPSGFLFVGPAETSLAAGSGFKPIDQAMSFAFRKVLDRGTTWAIPAKGARPPAANIVKTAPKQLVHRLTSQSPISRPLPACAMATPANLENAKRLADEGRLAEAGELCEMHIKKEGPSSNGYYLLGLVRDAMGDPQRAADCYRKVLYLDPAHMEALAHLALFAERQGDLNTAQRLRERAQRLAKAPGR